MPECWTLQTLVEGYLKIPGLTEHTARCVHRPGERERERGKRGWEEGRERLREKKTR